MVITVPVVAEGALPLQTVKSKFCAVVEVATVIVPVAGAVKLNQTSVLPVGVVKGELKVAPKVVPETDPPFTVMEVGAEERSLVGETLLPEPEVVTFALLEAPPPVRTTAVALLYVPGAIEAANRTQTVVLFATLMAEEPNPALALVVETSYPVCGVTVMLSALRLAPAAAKETPVEAVPAVVDRALPSTAAVREGEVDDQVKLKSSTAVTGLLLLPVVEDLVTIRIQTGPELSLSAFPKLTVTPVEPHVPVVVVNVDGDVVAFEKLVGEAPNP